MFVFLKCLIKVCLSNGLGGTDEDLISFDGGGENGDRVDLRYGTVPLQRLLNPGEKMLCGVNHAFDGDVYTVYQRVLFEVINPFANTTPRSE